MQRVKCALGILGIVVAAGAAHAGPPKEAELFGQKYSVTVQSRGGVYKNGVTITLQNEAGSGVETVQKANVSFAEGADPSADRLFVVAPIGTDSDGPTGDEFYMLTGTDAAGLFSTSNSNAKQFFGGNVDHNVGGRGQTVAWLSDTNTGATKDRNVALCTFTGNDRLQFYDLDTLASGFESDSVLSIDLNGDDNMPSGAWDAVTRAPNGFLVDVAGSGTWEMGVMDPTKDVFLEVKTDLLDATLASGKQIQHVDIAHGLARYGPDEYWILSSVGDPGGNNNDASGEQYLTRLKITFPADLTKSAPGGIKAELLGQEEIFAKNLAGSPGGIFGFTIGRETSPGKRVIYMTDWVGNLITLTPQ